MSVARHKKKISLEDKITRHKIKRSPLLLFLYPKHGSNLTNHRPNEQNNNNYNYNITTLHQLRISYELQPTYCTLGWHRSRREKSKREWISPDQGARVNLLWQPPRLRFAETHIIKVLTGAPAAF